MDTVLGGCKAGNSDLLTLAQRGDGPLFDALGLEREAQFAFEDNSYQLIARSSSV